MAHVYQIASGCFGFCSLILLVVLYRRIVKRSEFWANTIYWRDDLDRNPFVKLYGFKTHKLPIIAQEIGAFYATRFGKIVCRLWICSVVVGIIATVWLVYVDVAAVLGSKSN